MDCAILFLNFLTVLYNTYGSFICTCSLTSLFSHYSCPSTQFFSPTLSSSVSLPVAWSGMPYFPCLPVDLLYTVFKFQCYLPCESFLGILKIRSSLLYASSALNVYLNDSIVLRALNKSVSPKGHNALNAGITFVSVRGQFQRTESTQTRLSRKGFITDIIVNGYRVTGRGKGRLKIRHSGTTCETTLQNQAPREHYFF